jgi:hypothetical protein
MEKGNEFWHVECEKPVEVRVTRLARELARHKLDIVGVRRQMGHGKTRGSYFFPWKENENHQLGPGYYVQGRIVSAVKRLEFVSDSMSYMVLRCRLF